MTQAELVQYLIAAVAFFAVYILNGIKAEIKDLKVSLLKLEERLQEEESELDHRLTVIEERCKMSCPRK